MERRRIQHIFAATIVASVLLYLPLISSVSRLNSGEQSSDFDMVQSMMTDAGNKGEQERTELQRSRPHHDNSSLTAYMWYQGKPYNPLQDERPSMERSSSSLIIDAVSIGTKFAPRQMEAQANSWASHWSMRYLFGTTERDDADPTCHETMTEEQYHKFFHTCITKQYPGSRIKGIRRQMPKLSFMLKHNKTKGWVCAQQRFAHAVGKVGRFYRREGADSVPDYLFIQDDDTWFGMNQLTSFLSTKSRSKPFVTAGCLVEWPFRIVNFSFPFGGFGLMLNRVAVERLIKPIYCSNRTAITDAHTDLVCFRLEENLASERMAFEEGMSISDVMDRHAAMHPYRNYEEWGDPGYCMLGDWILGYYTNYYELGSRENEHLEYIHIDKSLGYIYKTPLGACSNHGLSQCRRAGSPYSCHRMRPRGMVEMSAIDAQNASRLLKISP